MSRRLHDWHLFVPAAAQSSANAWGRRFFTRYWYLAAIALALLSVWSWSCVMLGPNGWRSYQQNKAERRQLQFEIQQLQRENDRLGRRVRGLLSDPRVQEEEARNQGYVRPGEIIYMLRKTSPNTAGSQNPPRSMKILVQPGSRSPSERSGAAKGRLASSVPTVVLAFLATAAGLAVHPLWLRPTRGRWRLSGQKIS
jgi:cell division protein FtsB